MSNKPAIVLATGSFSLPEFYDQLFDPLRAQGYSISVPKLRTVKHLGTDVGPPPSMYDDAELIASEARKFADEGKDVVIFGHSYGGTPASEAVKGLTKAEREKDGKKGGVVRLGFITCLVPDVGAAAPSANNPDATGSYLNIGEDGWMSHPHPEVTAKYVFNRLSPEEGTKWVKAFGSHSAPSFTNELTYAGYKDVPSSWLLCEEDLCIEPKYQQGSIDRIEKVSGKKVDVTKVTLDHCPMVENPETVRKWFVDVLEKGGKWE